MKAPSPNRTLWLFGALVVYVAAQLIWWAVLLVRRDAEIAQLKMELAALSGVEHAAADPSRRLLMVLGEAGVFLVFLLGILFIVFRSVRRDLRLAGAQHNFLLAVTHELRSPIAAIKLQLRTLARPELDPQQRDQLRRDAAEEADRLAMLTDKVLQATTAEEGTVPLDLAPVEVMGVLRSVIERMKDHVAAGHELQLAGPTELEARMDAHALRSIAENLIENAAKYSPQGKSIQVEVRVQQDGWQLSVMDEGPGVPQDERARIFERFYRAGSEDVRATRGTGLGLYIVQRLVHRLGGRMEVRDRAPHGAIFAALFPTR